MNKKILIFNFRIEQIIFMRKLATIISFFLFFGVIARAQDTTPPASIVDLKVYRTYIPSSSKLILEWTTPGDDENEGTASAYDIRYATFPINESNWNLAIKANVSITPSSAGSKERVLITNLSNSTMYYFGIKTRDESDNWSGLSNIANRSTLPAIKAESGSPEDIQKAVDIIASLGGGVVYIPKGNFTFSINYTLKRINNGYAGVQIPGGVGVIGAGRDKTILFCPLSCWNYSLRSSQAFFVLDGRNNNPIRISGITFQGSVNLSLGADDDRYLAGILAYGVKDYRIDHNTFLDFPHTAIGVSGNYVHKWNRGVIDHNIFDNPYKDTFWNYTGNLPYWGYGIIVGGDYPNYPSMDYYLGNYHNNTAFIEDNLFSRHRHSIAMSASGGWSVVRRNNFTTMIISYYGSYIDAHGGARGYEVYNNMINNSPTDYRSVGNQTQYYGKYMGVGVNPRGGSGMVFNNTFINFDYGAAIQLSNDQSNPTYRLNGFWVWNNAFINVTTELGISAGDFNITEGKEYFLFKKSCYQPYLYPHPLTLEDLPENFDFSLLEKVRICSKLLDEKNNSVQAKITIFEEGSNNIITSTETDSKGNYNLTLSPGIYDVQFNLTDFFIPGYVIKLRSVNVSKNINNLIKSITQLPEENEVKIEIDNNYTKKIEVYNKKTPLKIKFNSTIVPCWSYDEASKKLYINLSVVIAKSGYWKDIQDAVDQVASMGGGSVYIPAGTWDFVEVNESWTGARVVIPAGVNLLGARTERYANGTVKEWKTVLVLPWDMPGNDTIGIPVWFKVQGRNMFSKEEKDPTKNFRFSEIKLVGYRSVDLNSTAMHIGLRIEGIINFRVDHCYFENIAGGIFITDSSGVIDHSLFVNTYGWGTPYENRTVGYGVHVHRHEYANQWDNFKDIVGKYLDYTVFIEDCYFSRWRHCVVGNKGAHVVFRHNIIQYGLGFGEVDMHEIYQKGFVGGRAYECYNNRIIDPLPETDYGHRWTIFLQRSGDGIYFNNEVRGGYNYFMYTYDTGWNSSYYPKNIYIWNNTGDYNHLIWGSPPLTEGVEYFLYKPDWYTPYPYPHPLTLE
jgi:hypothetical protein